MLVSVKKNSGILRFNSDGFEFYVLLDLPYRLLTSNSLCINL